MPNLNDFKLVAKKSEKYADILLNDTTSSQEVKELKKRERLGFYLFVLENICGIQDISDLRDLVTDTEFNQLVLGEDKKDDCGIDAIHIDEDEFSINLFNFKYREKFNPSAAQSLNAPFISAKFANALTTEKTDDLEGKIKDFAISIIEKLNSNDEWKLNLYVVSNENVELKESNDDIKRLEETYGLEVKAVGLTQITQYMSIRPEPINAELMLDNDAIMSFSEDPISSSKSYIIRLPINEVVRITCDNEEMRNLYNMENVYDLKDINLDYSVLFDNVRGLVTRSKYNKNISATLKKEPSKFFMYNNGLTLIAEDIEAVTTNANKKIKLKLKSFQVINGGQTLRTIHQFHKLDRENIVEYLSSSQILVRIFKTTNDKILNNKIAEYTNSQNSIESVDLKSLRPEQIQLEQYLSEHEVVYSRKTGDTGLADDKTYRHQISMERFGQILYALKGNPHRASNRKRDIFDKHYDEIFGEDALNVEESPAQIKKYFEIKSLYEDKRATDRYDATDQKVFYILYLQSETNRGEEELIDAFEESLEKYNSKEKEQMTKARPLVQIGFKKFVDEEFRIK